MHALASIWSPLAERGTPRSFAELEAWMLESERDRMADAPVTDEGIHSLSQISFGDRLRELLTPGTRREAL